MQPGDARARRVTVAGIMGSGAAGWPVTCPVLPAANRDALEEPPAFSASTS